MVTADLWFDPVCPWAWITSRWLMEVEGVRPMRARVHVFSLALHNQDREVDPWYRAWLDQRWGPARVVAAAERAHGGEVVRALCTAFGTRLHVDKRPVDRELSLDALAEVGLPPDLADAAGSTALDDVLAAGNAAALAPVGEDLGVPALHLPGPDGEVVAFFGPVVSPTPRGEAAGLLWDGVRLLAGTEGFSELKRARSRPDTAPAGGGPRRRSARVR
ncbi:disulfide bond formation protein DsbA [Actinosynnema sp. NPDC047251]|uniref:DSBA-like thioredoxin domain-containing protein n=1 Tax=Saccharothrix espanaensis (strain ATCC 51144 / DSM 44229 / JCM 9112 / NBRC 15066 / NRRL 15764) TaxID=1179773 RepID=K0JXP4_SACES|nr:hypothetical protein [Saccharothrix espanaensis]CCH30906.1 hypothetical protein BN6_36110 [Saccharothrix espanaensis DSM 44229]